MARAMAVRRDAFRLQFVRKTAATGRFASPESAAAHGALVAAIATAEPERVPVLVFVLEALNSPAAEALASKINEVAARLTRPW